MVLMNRLAATINVELEICSPIEGERMGQDFCAWGRTETPLTNATARGQAGTIDPTGPPTWRVCFTGVPLGAGPLVVDNDGGEQDSINIVIAEDGADEGTDSCIMAMGGAGDNAEYRIDGLDVPIPRPQPGDIEQLALRLRVVGAPYTFKIMGTLPREGFRVECRLGNVSGQVTYQGKKWTASFHIADPSLGVPQRLFALATDPNSGKTHFDQVWMQLGGK